MDKENQNPSFSKGNFVGLHRGEQADYLQKHHPASFLLLCLIARRARYTTEPCPLNGLRFAEAFIGDWKEAGLTSEKSYRCAKIRLEKGQLCAFRRATTGARRGTVATLLPQGVFSISNTGGASEEAPKGRARGRQGAGKGRQTTKEPVNQVNHDTKKPLTGVEEIYQAYPKKKGRPSALKAITKALKTIDHATLLKKTKAYAKAREGENVQYTPQPATWFNDERFNDEPTTWKSSIKSDTPARQPRQTVADLTAGKSSDIINALDLNLDASLDHE